MGKKRGEGKQLQASVILADVIKSILWKTLDKTVTGEHGRTENPTKHPYSPAFDKISQEINHKNINNIMKLCLYTVLDPSKLLVWNNLNKNDFHIKKMYTVYN